MKMQSTNSDWHNRRHVIFTTVVALFGFLLVGLATGCSDSSGTSSSKMTIQLGTSTTDARTVDVRTVDFKELFLQRQEERLNKPMENGFRDLIRACGPIALNPNLRPEFREWTSRKRMGVQLREVRNRSDRRTSILESTRTVRPPLPDQNSRRFREIRTHRRLMVAKT